LGETVSLQKLPESEGRILLSYPKYDEAIAGCRLRELRGLGVEAIDLRGPHMIGKVHVLGKGHVGVVVAALMGRRLFALKIRRMDADRESLSAEAEYLGMANGASVGPQLFASSSNFLVMEFIDGEYLVNWVEGLELSDEGRLRHVLRQLLDKARGLDGVGLDHGELNRAHRHVIVAGEEPRIIDFESASTGRRVANVTSITNYIYFNRHMRSMVEGVIPVPVKKDIVGALRRYKRSPIDANYDGLLRVCGLLA
jgi:putative serine/threonine protein kinase